LVYESIFYHYGDDFSGLTIFTGAAIGGSSHGAAGTIRKKEEKR
jgi:hypothetical protein